MLNALLALTLLPTAAAGDLDETEDGAYDGEVQWVARDEGATRALLRAFADEVEAGDLSMVLDERGAFLAFTEPITFETDRYRVRAPERRVLRDVARIMEDHPGIQLAVIGYADEWAPALPEMRAYAVRDVLADRGVPEAQLLPVGLGVNQYVDPAEDEAAHLNRRVELRLLPELDPAVIGMNELGVDD